MKKTPLCEYERNIQDIQDDFDLFIKRVIPICIALLYFLFYGIGWFIV